MNNELCPRSLISSIVWSRTCRKMDCCVNYRTRDRVWNCGTMGARIRTRDRVHSRVWDRVWEIINE